MREGVAGFCVICTRLPLRSSKISACAGCGGSGGGDARYTCNCVRWVSNTRVGIALTLVSIVVSLLLLLKFDALWCASVKAICSLTIITQLKTALWH